MNRNTAPPTLYGLTVLGIGGSDGKESVCNAGDTRGLGSVPGWEDPLGLGNASQYSCLENFIGRRAWWATVHGVAKSRA